MKEIEGSCHTAIEMWLICRFLDGSEAIVEIGVVDGQRGPEPERLRGSGPTGSGGFTRTGAIFMGKMPIGF
jgi:hypothetical protein